MTKLFSILKKVVIISVIVAIICGVSVLLIDFYVAGIGETHIKSIETAPNADAVIVLGALVIGNSVSPTLAQRLDMGYDVYQSGRAKKIIVSGDHGRTEYNEVSAMRQYLMDRGVPKEDIFMDHAGFNTYDTIYRARDVFLVEKAIIVTQREHLLRALYIADKLGLSGVGVESGQYERNEFLVQRPREYLARTKAFLQCEISKPKPKFLGETLPVSGSGRVTED